jgi:hypothetical protein
MGAKPAKKYSSISGRLLIVALALIGLAGYQIYRGGFLSDLELPGFLKIGFAPATTGAPPKPIASLEFVVGRWQVPSQREGLSGRTDIDYKGDGTCVGTDEGFQNGSGKQLRVVCRWAFKKLSDDSFEITSYRTIDNMPQPPWTGTFRIVSHDEIHNLAENYSAYRERF